MITKINDKKLIEKTLTSNDLHKNKAEIKSRLDRIKELKAEIKLLTTQINDFKYKNFNLRHELKLSTPKRQPIINKGRVPSILR